MPWLSELVETWRERELCLLHIEALGLSPPPASLEASVPAKSVVPATIPLERAIALWAPPLSLTP